MSAGKSRDQRRKSCLKEVLEVELSVFNKHIRRKIVFPVFIAVLITILTGCGKNSFTDKENSDVADLLRANIYTVPYSFSNRSDIHETKCVSTDPFLMYGLPGKVTLYYVSEDFSHHLKDTDPGYVYKVFWNASDVGSEEEVQEMYRNLKNKYGRTVRENIFLEETKFPSLTAEWSRNSTLFKMTAYKNGDDDSWEISLTWLDDNFDTLSSFW